MNRTSYYGSRLYRWLFGGMFVFFTGLLVWALYSAFVDSTTHPSDRQAGAWACLLLPLIMCFLGWVFREVTAIYTVDADGIEKRLLGRFQRLDWNDIADFHVRQDRGKEYKLTDLGRETLSVWGSWVERGRADLERVIDEVLATMRARYFEAFGTGRRYHPGRLGAVIFALIGIVSAALSGVVYWMPVRRGDPEWFPTVCAIGFLSIVGASGIYAFSEYVRILIVTAEEIAEHTLRSSRRIRFEELESIQLRKVYNHGSVTHFYTLRGGRAKITFSTGMQDGPLLLEFIRHQASGITVEDAAAPPDDPDKRRAWQRKRKLASIALVGIFLLVVGGMIGLSVFKLQLYRQFDAEGRPMMGGITEVAGNEVSFEFIVDGKRYSGQSKVIARDFESARPGNPIPVIYLPSDPSRCMAQESIGRSSAVGALVTGLVQLPIVIWVAFGLRRAAATA